MQTQTIAIFSVSSILWLNLFFVNITFAQQGYNSNDNNTGNWLDAGTWIKSAAWLADTPGTNVGGATDYINIYGYVTRAGDLDLGGSAIVKVYDTLWITGDLKIAGSANLIIESGGILIIDGQFDGSGGSLSSNDGNIIIKGGLSATGGADINNTANGNEGFYVFGSINRSGGAKFNGGNQVADGNFLSETELQNNNPDLYNFTNGTLPVKLVNITADFVDPEVELKWTTSSEINNERFDIQRATNGQDFSKLGEIQGNGTTNELHNYDYIDKHPVNGISYYRFKQVDFDGAFEFSPIVSVKANLSTAEFYAAPSVIHQGNVYVFLYNVLDGKTEVLIVNLKGKSFYMKTMNIQADIAQKLELIGTDHLETGIYILTFASGVNRYREKIIVDKG
ncbi:hypothetical protein QQ008_29350 [Fulvivirgaceae bacterium BMA10]|uniref:T9SS type A sorting domain-containing protein n=1 Tax=Splendidivirga corallicola TaxID=3051826 RepID=A0ABT8KXS3_9BACT|nr:hypothetical protein [Fulvivirgaceae bacterium BMA10]